MSKTKIFAIAASLLAGSAGIGFLYVSGSAPQAGFIDRQGRLQLTIPGLVDAGEFHDGLAPAKAGDNWGYLNKQGKWVIPPQFLRAQNFSEGLAAVILRNKKKYAFINMRAQGLLEFDATAVGDFHEGLALVANGDKCGYVDSSGSFVIPQQYQFGGIRNSAFGAIPVSFSDAKNKNKLRWQYINHENKAVVQETFLNAKDVKEGLAPVLVSVANIETKQKTTKWGFLDHTGKNFAVQPDFFDAEPFSEELAAVAISKQSDSGGNDRLLYSFVDKEKKVMPLSLTYAGSFSEGLAAAAENNEKVNNKGYIDKAGKFVIPARFVQANNFSEGLAFTRRAGFRPFWERY